MNKIYLRCIRHEEDWLKFGKVYEAFEEYDDDYGDLFVLTDEKKEESSFTQEPDADGLDYTHWFEVVSKEEHNLPLGDTMWIIVNTDTYYPSILHFATEDLAKDWLADYLKDNTRDEYDCYYIAKVTTHIKGLDFKEELEKNDIEWSIKR